MTTLSPSTLEQKIDQLTAQLQFVEAELREQRVRRSQWDDLREDLAPLTMEAMSIASRELEEIQEFTQADDLLRLVKRLLRNVRNIEQTLERLESAMDLVEDVGPLSREAFATALQLLDDADRRGYFAFARASLGVVDQVVANFTEDDVVQLGDNIVLILETVKEMTQPEIMAVLYRMIEAMQRQQAAMQVEPDEPPSTWQLLRRMRQPEVRRGLGRALNTLSAVSSVDVGPPRAFVTDPTPEIQNETEGGT